MRICLIGDFRTNLNEGFTNVASNLAGELSKDHEVIKLNLWHPFSPNLWSRIRKRRPEIIHYFTKPSLVSFWILKALAIYCGGAKTVMSALHPDALSLERKNIFKSSIPMLKPDLILVQSPGVAKMFTNFGCKIASISNGVDIERFYPHSPQSKQKLREKYGIDREKFVVLHVGHLKRNRNLQIFSQIQGKNTQVLIVASTYRRGSERKLHQELTKSGCIIWEHYFPNIEEIYALADCYLFPSFSGGCILLPLSVVEAMACNLPVISTKFGALPAIFRGDDGLLFAEKEEDFLPLLDKVKTGSMEINTRQKVLPYTWEKIAEATAKIYCKVVNEEGN